MQEGAWATDIDADEPLATRSVDPPIVQIDAGLLDEEFLYPPDFDVELARVQPYQGCISSWHRSSV
jgi:hypothetical protein